MDAQAIVTDLARLLSNFQGREYSGVIDRRTRFFGDLDFASIDAIVLGEALEARYAQKVPFHQLLADLGQRRAEDFTVGELADFLAEHLGTSR